MNNYYIRRRYAQLISYLITAVILTACGGGGGGGSSGVGSSTSSSFTSGAITGFGSVIINGIRFDDSSSSVSDDDESSRSRDDLRLGMVAEIEGSKLTSDDRGRHGSASTIRFGSEIVGPVGSVGANSLTVLGQTVQVTSTTVFDDSLANGLASIQVKDVVEVYGLPGAAAGQYTATRIEPKSNPQSFKLRGVVSNLNTTEKTFTIGSETISYSGLSANDLPSNLADGVRVRVKLQTTQVNGAWGATKIRNGVRSPGKHDEAELKGLITEFTSKFAFSVNGIPVNATNATFPKGDNLNVGTRVEVEGSAVDGVIVAKKVKIENDDDVRAEGFELHGSISNLDLAGKTFKLRGITVNYGNATFKGSTEGSLIDGIRIEVKGIPSADRTSLDAIKISIELS